MGYILRPSPFFSVYRRMRFLISGRSVGWKKKSLKKIISILGIGALVPQHNSCGTRKTTRHEPKINMAEKMVKVVAKLRQRGEKDQPPKLLCYINWLKNVVSFFFLFWKCQKFGSVGRREKEKKKGDGLNFLKTSCEKARDLTNQPKFPQKA